MHIYLTSFVDIIHRRTKSAASTSWDLCACMWARWSISWWYNVCTIPRPDAHVMFTFAPYAPLLCPPTGGHPRGLWLETGPWWRLPPPYLVREVPRVSPPTYLPTYLTSRAVFHCPSHRTRPLSHHCLQRHLSVPSVLQNRCVVSQHCRTQPQLKDWPVLIVCGLLGSKCTMLR